MPLYCYWYSKIHYRATGLEAQFNTDQTRIFQFIATLRNQHLTRKIIFGRKFLANLQETIDKAIELEVSFQLAEGIDMACPTHNPQAMNINQLEYQENTPMTIKEIIDH